MTNATTRGDSPPFVGIQDSHFHTINMVVEEDKFLAFKLQMTSLFESTTKSVFASSLSGMCIIVLFDFK